MIVRLTEIIRRQLIADTGFGPVQVRGKLGQKCQIRFFSFDDPAGDGQTVDRRESFLTCMRGKENDAAIIFLCGVIIISAGLSIGFTGISAEFQIREGHAHITVMVLAGVRNFGIVGKLCRPQHGTQWKYDPENCKQNQIYHWRKKSSAIEGLNIFGNIMFVVVRHGKSFLYFNLCIQYKGFGKNNQPCYCHKNLLNYDTKLEEKNGRVYEFCAGLRPVYG